MGIIADYAVFVPRETRDKSKRENYIFAITPLTSTTDEGDDWEGSNTSIKNAITASSLQV